MVTESHDAPPTLGIADFYADWPHVTVDEQTLLDTLDAVASQFVRLAPDRPSRPEDVEDAVRHVRALQRMVLQNVAARVTYDVPPFGGDETATLEDALADVRLVPAVACPRPATFWRRLLGR